ncbi:hypothetical protein [Leptospira noguchii]|nr:hypothetical protein [Leptospira noguchii]
MLRSIVSNIEFKFRRNWSENEQLKPSRFSYVSCVKPFRNFIT